MGVGTRPRGSAGRRGRRRCLTDTGIGGGSEVKKIGNDLNGHGVVLRVNPEIARALKEEERTVMSDLQNALGRNITIKPDTHLHHEQFDLMAT